MTETESMVVRVAKAINAAGMAWLNENDPKRMTLSWADVPDEVFARAAIEAMKEPTDLMGNGLPSDYRPGSHSATQIWQAMIVKALEE